MTTLVGDRLMSYLGNLKFQINYIDDNDSSELHTQMYELIEAEERLQKYFQGNGHEEVSLAFSGNGLPSIESLKADLETMCELSDEEPVFKEVGEMYQRGINGLGDENFKYRKISKDDWNFEKERFNHDDLSVRKGLEVSETDDGKFELRFSEDYYFEGIDDYSKKFPALSKRGMVRYQSVMNQIFAQTNEEFYVPDLEEVLSGGGINKSRTKKLVRRRCGKKFEKIMKYKKEEKSRRINQIKFAGRQILCYDKNNTMIDIYEKQQGGYVVSALQYIRDEANNDEELIDVINGYFDDFDESLKQKLINKIFKEKKEVSNIKIAGSLGLDVLKFCKEALRMAYNSPGFMKKYGVLDYIDIKGDISPLLFPIIGQLVVHNAWYVPLVQISSDEFSFDPGLMIAGIFTPWILNGIYLGHFLIKRVAEFKRNKLEKKLLGKGEE